MRPVSHFLTSVSLFSAVPRSDAIPFTTHFSSWWGFTSWAVSPPWALSGWSFCFWLLVLQTARCLHILWTLISVTHVLIISFHQSSCPFSFNFLVWLRATCFSQSCSLKIVNASIPGQLPPLQFSASLPWRRTPDCLLGHTAPLPTDTTEDTEGVTEMLLGPVN